MTDVDTESEGLGTRVVKLETQRNFATALVLLFGAAIAGGAWDVSQKAVRYEERLSRLTADVQGASAGIARLDRVEERLNSVARSVDRIEADVTRTREGVDSLRSALSLRRTAHASVPTRTTPHRALARR